MGVQHYFTVCVFLAFKKEFGKNDICNLVVIFYLIGRYVIEHYIELEVLGN